MFRLLLAACFTLCLAATVRAADLPQPQGPVILTLHGNVANTNRGAVDEFGDALFKAGKVGFDRAASFDLAMLEKLGMHRVTPRRERWPKAILFEGPLLADVLAAAGASGSVTTVRLYGLDGFEGEIAMSELRVYKAVLALKADGQYLGLGGRGPSWVVWPPETPVVPHDGRKWPWSVIRIVVE